MALTWSAIITQLVDGRVRVLSEGRWAGLFELKTEDVTGYETVPDPPRWLWESPSRNALAATRTPADRKHGLRPAICTSSFESRGGAQCRRRSAGQRGEGGERRICPRDQPGRGAGLMQLMPGTAQELGVADSFAPDENVRGGTAYLDWLLTRYHDNIALALGCLQCRAGGGGPVSWDSAVS